MENPTWKIIDKVALDLRIVLCRDTQGGPAEEPPGLMGFS